MNKTGIIAGAFDVIHPGYILAFAEAKMFCSKLIVLLHVDPSIQNPEKSTPILSVSERVLILNSIRFVDRIAIYETEKDLGDLLVKLNPDIRFLGKDYDMGIKEITGKELNIPIHFLDRSHGWSATKFKELILGPMEKK